VDQRQDDEMHAVDASKPWPRDATPVREFPTGESVPKKVVLVVEDDESVSSLLVALLEDRGYDAIPAMDGQSAIELARKHIPHLITLDLALPGTDGHEVLESLKAPADSRDSRRGHLGLHPDSAGR